MLVMHGHFRYTTFDEKNSEVDVAKSSPNRWPRAQNTLIVGQNDIRSPTVSGACEKSNVTVEVARQDE